MALYPGLKKAMPRDSLDLIQQHTSLLDRRDRCKKRTRLRDRVPDDWKSDKVYPHDKPASYTPSSPGRDVISGGYLRSEYQIEVHSRDYARSVVKRRELHQDRAGERHDTCTNGEATKVKKRDLVLPLIPWIEKRKPPQRPNGTSNEDSRSTAFIQPRKSKHSPPTAPEDDITGSFPSCSTLRYTSNPDKALPDLPNKGAAVPSIFRETKQERD